MSHNPAPHRPPHHRGASSLAFCHLSPAPNSLSPPDAHSSDSRSRSPDPANPPSPSDAPTEPLLRSIILTPLYFSSFLLSLFLIDYRARAWRSAQHPSYTSSSSPTSPSGAPSLPSRLTALFQRLASHLDPEPYQDQEHYQYQEHFQDPYSTIWHRASASTSTSTSTSSRGVLVPGHEPESGSDQRVDSDRWVDSDRRVDSYQAQAQWQYQWQSQWQQGDREKEKEKKRSKSWALGSAHRKIVRMEVGDALEMRGVVLAAMGAVVVLGVAGVWVVGGLVMGGRW